MTQVKEWSNQELNRKLAELMGWQAGGDPNKQRDFVWWVDDNRFRLPEKWEPCTDPAASLEVQTAACKVDGERYIWELAIIQGWVGGKIISRKEGVRIATAIPRERAEAAYITLQGAVNT
ncbi:hypothetical protein [Paenibacillus graminis]|uniref:hypothetical protein n=1 Tax=Paenibacillus graminis TaxID=189425 RepID=UPI002DBD61AC|nr:hypothetical protein [Paenibacillus graminis]MEC0169748.1 hypothetical protein [Paenibacillus graminis]